MTLRMFLQGPPHFPRSFVKPKRRVLPGEVTYRKTSYTIWVLQPSSLAIHCAQYGVPRWTFKHATTRSRIVAIRGTLSTPSPPVFTLPHRVRPETYRYLSLFGTDRNTRLKI